MVKYLAQCKVAIFSEYGSDNLKKMVVGSRSSSYTCFFFRLLLFGWVQLSTVNSGSSFSLVKITTLNQLRQTLQTPDRKCLSWERLWPPLGSDKSHSVNGVHYELLRSVPFCSYRKDPFHILAKSFSPLNPQPVWSPDWLRTTVRGFVKGWLVFLFVSDLFWPLSCALEVVCLVWQITHSCAVTHVLHFLSSADPASHNAASVCLRVFQSVLHQKHVYSVRDIKDAMQKLSCHSLSYMFKWSF